MKVAIPYQISIDKILHCLGFGISKITGVSIYIYMGIGHMYLYGHMGSIWTKRKQLNTMSALQGKLTSALLSGWRNAQSRVQEGQK